ncbi:DUF3597 domain-containing protein [Sphingomonas sp. ID1715]|uniref:DUF3597 domain-containing protein n=1 Tax=Sphingomonas sp. ID1715 TaxID=1656898 RepID=UPI00148968A5|nr:DUF3597 domain-containing protein [Sphingomonas sp. ID1715]NNM76675.1 DUF3597 domain-containing protein [Sphingomonas sp. ID1715]
MSIFSAIKHAIFGDKGPLGGQFSGHKDQPAAAPVQHANAAPARPVPQQPAAPTAQPTAAPQAQPQPVDVEAVLSARSGADRLDWRHSIVDLLKLLELDSSLAARKELAGELSVHAGADGSAEQNIALQKAVMRALAQNGGKVPAELQD